MCSDECLALLGLIFLEMLVLLPYFEFCYIYIIHTVMFPVLQECILHMLHNMLFNHQCIVSIVQRKQITFKLYIQSTEESKSSTNIVNIQNIEVEMIEVPSKPGL